MHIFKAHTWIILDIHIPCEAIMTIKMTNTCIASQSFFLPYCYPFLHPSLPYPAFPGQPLICCHSILVCIIYILYSIYSFLFCFSYSALLFWNSSILLCGVSIVHYFFCLVFHCMEMPQFDYPFTYFFWSMSHSCDSESIYSVSWIKCTNYAYDHSLND